MHPWIATAGSAGISAGLVYLFDPVSGNRRRALLRDRTTGTLHEFSDFMDVARRDLKNRTRGFLNEISHQLRMERVSDDVLVRRVAAKIGHYISHPRAIGITANDACVTLRGPMLRAEVEAAITAILGVPGVKEVRNELEVHEHADIPELQGKSERLYYQNEKSQEYWSPAKRLVCGSAGLCLMLDGTRRLPLFGIGFVELTAGSLLLARSVSNLPVTRLIGLGSMRHGVTFHKTLTIAAPIDEVFAFFTNVENFPQLMRNIREVRDLGSDRSHWIARGPAGIDVAWNAEVKQYRPNAYMAWRSVKGSAIAQTGSVAFEDLGDAGTRVTLHMSYTPPVGALGYGIASIFGANPKLKMEEDMQRVQSLFAAKKMNRSHAAPESQGTHLH